MAGGNAGTRRARGPGLTVPERQVQMGESDNKRGGRVHGGVMYENTGRASVHGKQVRVHEPLAPCDSRRARAQDTVFGHRPMDKYEYSWIRKYEKTCRRKLNHTGRPLTSASMSTCTIGHRPSEEYEYS